VLQKNLRDDLTQRVRLRHGQNANNKSAQNREPEKDADVIQLSQ